MTPFLSYGFRPFFLLLAIAAPVTLAVLIGVLAGALPFDTDALPLYRWHGHEMLFGFVVAAIAGFLLTATPTWTQTTPVSGARLGALAALWVAGRFVVAPVSGLHATPAVLIELAFLPALTVALAWPIVRRRNVRNLPFVVLLALLFAADVVFHLQQVGWLGPLTFDPLRLAANIVLVIVVVVGGRIVPAFTRNALLRTAGRSGIRPQPWLERLSLVGIAAVVVLDLVAPFGRATGVVAAVTGVLIAWRLVGWEGWRTLRMPIVLILHIGYAWIAVALWLKAAWLLGTAPWAMNWLHAQTAGVFGTMILGVTTRVALGHTGRPLEVGRAVVVAYALVIVGALVRVIGPGTLPFSPVHVYACAAVLWSAAFVVFLVVYWPILLGPRADQPAA